MRHAPSPQKTQTGSTLVVSLIILIVLMMLGVTAMNTSDTQYKLAGNLQFENAALNNTETSIATAENWLASGTNARASGFTTYNSAATPHIYPIGYLEALAAPGNDVLTMPWSDSNSAEVTPGDPTQRYIIERMSTDNILTGSSAAIGGRPSSGCNKVNTYRITARGTSARGATKYIQSYYSVLSCT